MLILFTPPVFVTQNLTITRPCMLFAFAFSGYFVFTAINSRSSLSPPGNRGISSTTTKGVSSSVFELFMDAGTEDPIAEISSNLSGLRRKLKDVPYANLTGCPFSIPGCHTGIDFVILNASASSDGDAPVAILICDRFPSFSIMKLTCTVPSNPAFFALEGYFSFFILNCSSPF